MSKVISSPEKINPEKTNKDAARKKPVIDEKSASEAIASAPQPANTVSREDDPSQLLRRTKTTASALAQLEKGIESLYRKDFKKASAEMQSLIEKYPNDADIAVRARAYLDICRRGEARQKNTPATHDQTYALGVMEHNSANYDKAIEYFRQSLEKYPRADYIYYSIAASHALNGNVSAAIESLRKAVELNRVSLVHAKSDSDFAALSGNAEFQELLGITRRV